MSQTMRVLHTIGSVRPETGGPARSAQGLAVGLETCGVETWLLSFQEGDVPWFKDVKHFVAAKQAGHRGYCEAMRAAVAQAKPELIHCYGVWSPYVRVAVKEAVRVGIPVVVAPQGCFSPWAMKHKWLKKLLAWWVYQRWDLKKAVAFHATSEEEAKDIRRMGFQQPILVVPNGVEMPAQTWGGEPLRQQAIRVALFLSRLHPGKGLLDLAEAWAKVKAEGHLNSNVPEVNSGGVLPSVAGAPLAGLWRMRVVGPDSYGHKAEVISRLKALGIEKEWEFVEEVSDDEKWREYASANLFIHPSHSENFGISIAEALYARLPVITTRGAPWQELLGSENRAISAMSRGSGKSENGTTSKLNAPDALHPAIEANGRCGWWIDIGVDPLAEALKVAMALSDHERDEMGRNGRRLVERKYMWPTVAAQMRTAYEWLLKGGGAPECTRLT